MTGLVTVLEPGLKTSVQDLGRRGYQHLGFGVSGAVDERSLILANLLVGNQINTAGLEVTVRGPRLAFGLGTQIAIVGCEPEISLNERAVDHNRTLSVAAGDVLRIGRTGGARAYFAVRGGIDVPQLLASRSTDLIAKLGGLSGTTLQAGDELPITAMEPTDVLRLHPSWAPERKRLLSVRCSVGPQIGMFDDESIDIFTASLYSVDPMSDRMGVRLKGQSLPSPPQILSEGQPSGAVQIPPSGLPIVLLAGRQTVGGYAKIAIVARPDISELGQLLPGDVVKFTFAEFSDLTADTNRWLSGVRDGGRSTMKV